MAPLPPPDRRPLRHAGDGWVDCGCGSQHWGVFGAAGLLLAQVTAGSPEEADGAGLEVLLQHRALWSHHGGTWAIPGGALSPLETPADGALREAVEEAGVPDDAVRLWASTTLRHPDWSYTTIVAEATRPFRPHAGDGESLEVAWVSTDRVAERPLLPAFATAWPQHRLAIGRRAAVVVDAANVVGSRPDGWWRDRPGAAARLHARLVRALPGGLPGELLNLPAERWWPDAVVVLEGAARAADVGASLDGAPTPSARPTVGVVRASGEGDAEILRQVEQALRPGGYTDVVVVTADRALAARSRARGAAVAGPTALLDLI